jgi:hypothetical protein
MLKDTQENQDRSSGLRSMVLVDRGNVGRNLKKRKTFPGMICHGRRAGWFCESR